MKVAKRAHDERNGPGSGFQWPRPSNFFPWTGASKAARGGEGNRDSTANVFWFKARAAHSLARRFAAPSRPFCYHGVGASRPFNLAARFPLPPEGSTRRPVGQDPDREAGSWFLADINQTAVLWKGEPPTGSKRSTPEGAKVYATE
jgi:hypothetical protein